MRLFRDSPELAKVCAAQAMNSFGSSMSPIALAFTMLGRDDGLVGLATILCATALGPAVVILFGGVAADRGNRARLIVVSRLISGAIQVLIGVLVLLGITAPWLLSILSFAMSSLAAYTIPASRAMVRDLVGPTSLQRGTALMSLCVDTARLLGPGLAAVLLLIAPHGIVLLIDAATFFVSALLMLGVRLAPLPGKRAGTLTELLAGLRYSATQRWLLTTALCGMVVNGAWMAGYQLISPALSNRVYGGATFWGICGVSYTAGLLAGGFAALHIRARNPVVASVAASAGLSLPLFALGSHLHESLVIVAIFTATGLLALAMSWWSAGVPEHVGQSQLARAFSFNSAMELGGVPIAYAAAGLATAATTFAPQALALLAGNIILIASAANLILLRTIARPTPLACSALQTPHVGS
ncbi:MULTISPECIES: MFS transporter [unclassified Microbacterium]|uniref:MFS transporter n=1 Tax=unclassified Microbacterium TaxID=2609290 RepID=UPI0030197112